MASVQNAHLRFAFAETFGGTGDWHLYCYKTHAREADERPTFLAAIKHSLSLGTRILYTHFTAVLPSVNWSPQVSSPVRVSKQISEYI
jgi:hypothetical protein